MPGTPLYGQTMDTPNESWGNAAQQFESGVTGTFHIDVDSVMEDPSISYSRYILIMPAMTDIVTRIYEAIYSDFDLART